MQHFLRLLSLAALLAAAAHATTIPTSTGTALDGHAVVLPRDLTAHATVFILGFSKNSVDPTNAWQRPIQTALATDHIHYFDIPFLEDAPSFIRPIILRSIRKQVPDIVKPNYVPLTSGQAAWKQLAGFTPSASDAAYILLVDRSGTVLWQTHEAFTPARFAELSTAAHKLAAQ